MRKELWQDTIELVNRAFPINVFHTAFQPDDVLALHWHEHFEIIRIERGTAKIQVGGKQWIGASGDIYFVNSGELHAVYEPRDDFLMYAIVFHPSLTALHAADSASLELAAPYTAGIKTITAALRPGNEHYGMINGVLDLLIEEFGGRGDHYEQAVRSLCRTAFLWFARWFTENTADGQLQQFRQKSERFKHLLDFIGQRYMEPITVERAARMVHLSPYHFCNTFKRLTGLTLIQFVNLQRIQEAERLLSNGTLTISEIAANVGCGSLQSFSKLYKQYRGRAPSKSRKINP